MLHSLFPYLNDSSHIALEDGVCLQAFPHEHGCSYMLFCVKHLKRLQLMSLREEFEVDTATALQLMCNHSYECLYGSHAVKMQVLCMFFRFMCHSMDEYETHTARLDQLGLEFADQLLRLAWMWDNQPLVKFLYHKYDNLLPDVPWYIINYVLDTID